MARKALTLEESLQIVQDSETGAPATDRPPRQGAALDRPRDVRLPDLHRPLRRAGRQQTTVGPSNLRAAALLSLLPRFQEVAAQQAGHSGRDLGRAGRGVRNLHVHQLRTHRAFGRPRRALRLHHRRLSDGVRPGSRQALGLADPARSNDRVPALRLLRSLPAGRARAPRLFNQAHHRSLVHDGGGPLGRGAARVGHLRLPVRRVRLVS